MMKVKIMTTGSPAFEKVKIGMKSQSMTRTRPTNSMKTPSTTAMNHGPMTEMTLPHLRLMSWQKSNDMAFASYTDARKRFQELKMSRGYLPIVALTDQQGGHSPASTTTSPSSWRVKGKGKGSLANPSPRPTSATPTPTLDQLIPGQEQKLR